MELISYAQNFEDVMLWRALATQRDGFYIDVGAAWPAQDSVTKLFYDRGWRGINVEPNPHLFTLLTQARERDINLPIAVSNVEGIATMQVAAGTGLSTLDATVGAGLRDSDFPVEEIEVPALRLSEIWDRHVPHGHDVHFVKVDVEGFEEQVLRSWDSERHRPWVLVIEATSPGSTVEVHDAWEHLVLEANYRFAYADGLNRFYVADERSSLLAAFRFPPNVFDGFRLAVAVDAEARATSAQFEVTVVSDRVASLETQLVETQSECEVSQEALHTARRRTGTLARQVTTLRRELEAARSERDSALARADEFERQASEAHAEADRIDQHVRLIYSSASWRLSSPLRRCKLATGGLLRATAGPLLVRLESLAMRRPVVRRTASIALRLTPKIRSRIHRYLISRTSSAMATGDRWGESTSDSDLIGTNSTPSESTTTLSVLRLLEESLLRCDSEGVASR